MEERHRGVGDVAFLLEPDLKESHGGLRDVNVLRAISAYAPLLADYADLASLEPADRPPHPGAGRAPPDRRARAGPAAPAGPGPDRRRPGLRGCRRPHGRRLGGRAPDRLGQRRRLAPAPPVGPHPAAQAAPMAPAPGRPPGRGARADPRGPRHGGHRRRDRPPSDRAGLGGRVARLSPGRHRGRARPADRQRVPAPPGRPYAAAGRPVAPRGARGAPAPPGRRAPGHRQDRVARPARAPGAAHPRVGRRAEQAAAQRLPHLYRRPAPPGSRRAGGGAHRPGRAAGPPVDRRPAARHRQGFPGRPHDGGHGAGPPHGDPHGFRSRGRRNPGGPGAVPPPPPRHRHPTRPGRPDDGVQRGPSGGQPGHAAPARRPDRSRQPRHRPLGLGLVEGRAGGGARHAGRTASWRARPGRRAPLPSPRLPGPGRRGATPAGSPRSLSSRPVWSSPHPTDRDCSRPWRGHWRSTAWTCGRPT